jgi:hypothetical protein
VLETAPRAAVGCDDAAVDLRSLLVETAAHVADYRSAAADSPVAPGPGAADAVRAALGGLRDEPAEPAAVVKELTAAVEPGLVATTGHRYFGFVIGGALPAATAADMLAVGWDQPAFNAVTSPAAAVVEDVAGAWLKELLGLPAAASVGFVTGGRRRTRWHWLPPGTGCWPTPAGTSSATVSSVPRGCEWWRRPSGT